MIRTLFSILLFLLLLLKNLAAQETNPVHALTLLDAPKYGPDWQYPDYVNPDAPKGGTINRAAIGTAFDTFNPFTIRGTPAVGSGLIYESLAASPEDDANSEYGLIAKSMEIAPDKSWIIFNLREEARWHDGKPITAEDVVFSFNILKEKGLPFYRLYYENVVKAEALEDHRVKFTFKDGNNRELPVIMAQLSVLPKHYWEGKNFEESGLDIPLGSGPYRIKSFEAGRSVTLERVKDYWGANLPLRRGQNNFDVIRYDYYRDSTVALEAFKAGAYDLRGESSAKNWATAYDIPQVKDGRIKRETFKDANAEPMQAFIFNIRRDLFKDRKVREALNYAFDFEWTNKALFFGQYKRTRSYFQNSELEAKGLPAGEELAILEKYRGKIPDEVFTQSYSPPVTDGSGNNRDNLAKADQLLQEAGWILQNGQRMKDGKPFRFEILLDQPTFERVVQPIIQNLQRLGIEASLRTVDAAQYQNRVQSFDFDMISEGFAQSLSPGNEQRDFWGSAAANQEGSRNTVGIKDPAIDQLVEELIAAPDRQSLILHTKALDRVLQWNYFVIPQWYLEGTWVAYWDKFGRPSTTPKYGPGLNSWWIDPAKEAKIKQSRNVTPEAGTNPPPTETAATNNQPANIPETNAESTPADKRGQSPILYIFGLVATFIVGIWLGKRLGRK